MAGSLYLIGEEKAMGETVDLLYSIANYIYGCTKKNMTIENDSGNDLVDAYNEGVRAMAEQAVHYINSVAECQKIKEKYLNGGENNG